MPEFVRIGGVDYEVNEVDGLHDGGVYLNGHVVFDDCKILINSDMAPFMKWVAIWHEILHALLYHAGIDDEEIEGAIRALGYGVTQVLRDNPELREAK